MAQSSLLCANLALRLLGSRAVLTSLSDTSVEGLACNANIDDCKRTLLRMYPWNFAIKRTVIEPTYVSLDSVVENSGENQIGTSGLHGLTTGQWVLIEDAEGDVDVNGVYQVSVLSTSSFIALNSVFDEVNVYTPATGTLTRSAAFGFNYSLPLPSDFVRLLNVNDEVTNPDLWRLEEGRIITDETRIELRYIYDIIDYTLMDPMFYQCLAHYLAYNLCDHITASDAKKNELHAYLYGTEGRKGILPSSRFSDATEDPPGEIQANDWVGARFSADVTSL